MSFYIFPTLLFSGYWKAERIIFGGYGFQSGVSGIPLIDLNSASNIMEKGLYHGINILNHLWEALTVSFTAANDATWDYSLYIGEFGLILVILCLVVLVFKNWRQFSLLNHRYLLAAVIVGILSISIFEREFVYFFETVTHVTIPKVDRLPSRLMIYPFSLVLILAAVGFDDLFSKIPENFRSYVKWGALLILSIILMQDSYGWSVAQTESHYVRPPDEVRHLFKTVILDIEGDDFYKKVVNISYLVSFLMVVAVTSAYFYLSYLIKMETKQHQNES